MKVTYLNDGIRYCRNCDDICGLFKFYGLIYETPEGESIIWLDVKTTTIESVED